MAVYDVQYTNGVIAVREKNFLGEKLLRICEMQPEDAFRFLLDSGFGAGAEGVNDVHDFEKLVAIEDSRLYAFIREYAPSKAELEYLLVPNDFHNAKALLKAKSLGVSADNMLASEGLIAIKTLSDCVNEGDFAPLKDFAYLKTACEEVSALLEEDKDGAKVGQIFDKALFEQLWQVLKGKKFLRGLLSEKADVTNVLTALRSKDAESALDSYLPHGKLKITELEKLFDTDAEKTKKYFANTEYADFISVCLTAKEKGKPLSEGEKVRDSREVEYFARRKYELQKSEPFLYFVYRKKTELSNVRIAFVCLNAGLSETAIKARLRSF